MPSSSNSSRRQQRKARAASAPRREWLAPALIFVSAFLLYANTLGHDYALDDRIYTTENVYVQQGFSAFKEIWTKGSLVGFNGANDNNYRPLVLLTFMAETQAFGLNPHASHFFNVLLFALSCVLIYFLLRGLFPALNRSVPALMALLFAFHPVHAEAVANIKSRDEILCLLFGVVCLLSLRRHVDTSRPSYYWASVMAFGLSVLCKESGVTFVLVVPLLLYFFTDSDAKRISTLTAAYAAVVVLYLIVRRSVLDTVTFDRLPIMNNALMAAKTTGDMLATNFVMLGKYVYLLVIPYPLSWDYSYNQIPIVSFGDARAIASLLLYISMGVYVLVRLRRKDTFVFAILPVPDHPFCLVQPFRQNRSHLRRTFSVHAVAGFLHRRAAAPGPDSQD